MSVESVMARIQEIESRMASFAPAPAAPAQAATAATAGNAAAAMQAASFEQALASRTGATGAVGESLGAPSKYDGMIRQVAQETGVPAALIKAVAKQESDFDPRCSSSAGAQGLMQLMPETQRSLGVTDPYDPLQSLRGGARELRGYLEQFHGDLTLSLAAYNAGPNAVRRYGGVPPYAETQAYIPKVLGYYRSFGGDPSQPVVPGAQQKAVTTTPAAALPGATAATGIPAGYALVPLSSLGIGATATTAGTDATQQTLQALLARVGLAGTTGAATTTTTDPALADTGSIL